jgi:hypothetical protein
MKTIFGVIVLLVISLSFTFILAFAVYARAEEDAFDSLLLHEAADYAAEAAMSRCKEIKDIELEYTQESVIILSPTEATDTFTAIMCIAYNIPPVQRNTDEVLSKISVMALAENDGYYVGEQTQISDEGDTTLLWHVKKPYSIEKNGYTFGVELSRDKWTRVRNADLMYDEGTGYGAMPFTKEEMLQKINRDLNRDITAILGRYAANNNLPEYQRFYLPFAEGKAGVKRVEYPTLIAVIDGLSLRGRKQLTLSVVSGLKVVSKKYIVAWTDESGLKWYAHEEYTTAAERSLSDINGRLFTRVEDASRAGYSPRL